MSGRPAGFDLAGFAAVLDATRTARGLTWRKAAAEAGTSPSSFTRIRIHRQKPDMDTFAALVVWAGTSADTFIPGSRAAGPEPLPVILARFRPHSGLGPRLATAFEQAVLAIYAAFRDSAEGENL